MIDLSFDLNSFTDLVCLSSGLRELNSLGARKKERWAPGWAVAVRQRGM